MAATGEKAYVRKLLRDFFVFHWMNSVDEMHYIAFMARLQVYIEENGWPKKVVLYLNSSGGDLDIAWSLYDYVRLSGLHLVTIGVGDVESAAVLLFLAGKERYASKSSSFLIHGPVLELHNAELSESNIEQTKLHVLSMHYRYLKVLSKVTGLSKKEMIALAKGASPFPAKRAKELGIVHHIV